MDFTIQNYKNLILSFINIKYQFQTLLEYLQVPAIRCLVLRHDIDRLPENAFEIAKLENEFGVRSTYYFRIKKSVFNKNIIKEIAGLGHEIGYHYEDFAEEKGNYEKAIESFEANLNKLRRIYPVKTICMHGSPLSRYDNRELWEKYDYRDFGIIGEPYLDGDFNEMLYLTDTGRAWNTSRGNVRDKVQSKYNYNFKSTFDIIKALEKKELPDKIMLNVHPQRWNDKFVPWAKELVWQNIKNVMKKTFFRG